MFIKESIVRKIFRNFIKVVKYISKIDRKYCFIISIFVVVTSILPGISLKVMQQIINLIQTQIGNIQSIIILILVYLCIGFFEMFSSSALNYYKTKFLFKFNIDLKKEVLEKASRLNLKNYETSETYDMLQRAENQTDGVLVEFFDTVLDILGTIITGITYLIIVASFKAWIIPLLIFLPLIRFFVVNKVNVEEFNLVQRRTDKERKAWYTGYLITCGFNFKELKIYNLFSHFINENISLLKIFAKQDIGILRKRIKILLLFGVFEQLFIGTLFGYTIYCGYAGSILIGDVITYTRAMISSKEQIQSGIQTLSELNKSCLFFEQLFNFLDIEEEKKDFKYHIKKISKIEIKNLSFKYNTCDEYVLKDINLSITKNDFVAIVGRNGSGKSTLLKILLGLYDTYEGEILVDGKNLREINKNDYYGLIGVLFQDFTKYEATIRENISFSNLGQIHEDKELLSAAEKFGMKQFINQQRKGLDTQLGYWFETGKELSNGQWQKIGLTRAFMRNADLYFLDEPNSALDVISEEHILKSYEKIFKNKIGIIIIHKISSYIDKANKIVVLNNGNIDGVGAHNELLENSNEYKSLFYGDTRDK